MLAFIWTLLQSKEAWFVAIGFVLGGLILGISGYEIGFARGNKYGYSRYAAQQSIEDHRAEQNRKADDSAIQNQSDYDVCVGSLRSRRLPIDACGELLGIQ